MVDKIWERDWLASPVWWGTPRPWQMGQTEVAPACLHQKTPLLFSGSQRVCQVFLVTRKEKNYHCNQVIFIAWPKSSDLWCKPVLKKLHKAEGGRPTVSKFVPARARLPFAFLLTHLLCPLDTIPRAAFQCSGSLSSKAVLWLIRIARGSPSSR